MNMNDIFNMYFGIIEDNRDPFTITHRLIDVLKLVMISVLCGMDELDKMIDYGNNKKEFLEKEFDIRTIPSKATLTRIFVMIDPKWLGLSIVGIVQSLIKEKYIQIMLDGKAIKSTDAIKSIEKMMNIVTAYTDTYAMFDDNYMYKTDKECEYEIYKTQEKSHGRIETRTCYVLNEIAFFTDYLANWKGLKKIFAVKREVEKDGKKSKEISCYLSSKNTTAEQLLRYTRKHWQIESMHHILDVTYDEDRCKLLSQRAQENLNIFRKMGISIHKNYLKNKKQTVKSNMFNCLLNNNLLLEVIGNITIL